MEKNLEEVRRFATFPSNYAGLMDEKGCPNMYDGKFRIVDPDGKSLPNLIPADYLQFIGEHVEPWSYLKFPFFKPQGYPDGCYRVGPLGRVNAAERMSTPKADQALRAYRRLVGRSEGEHLLYHYTRMIELLNCLEKAEVFSKIPEYAAKTSGSPRIHRMKRGLASLRRREGL